MGETSRRKRFSRAAEVSDAKRARAAVSYAGKLPWFQLQGDRGPGRACQLQTKRVGVHARGGVHANFE